VKERIPEAWDGLRPDCSELKSPELPARKRDKLPSPDEPTPQQLRKARRIRKHHLEGKVEESSGPEQLAKIKALLTRRRF
jgi:hypothetical protein